MCRKNEVNSSFIKPDTLFFTTAFNVPKLAILSTAKHLKYSMKYADLKWGALKTHKICYEWSICIKIFGIKVTFLMAVYFFWKLCDC